MNEYNEGDLVEATKGDAVLRGRIYDRSVNAWAIDEFATLAHYEREGFTVTVIEKAKPKVELPTEPGVYLGFDQVAETGIVVVVSSFGDICLPDASKHLGIGGKLGNPERFAPFTRLEPRAVTGRAVIKAVNRIPHIDGDSAVNLRYGLAQVATEFGVTND